MIWHDCNIDPPKEEGQYLLWFKAGFKPHDKDGEDDWEKAYYCVEQKLWADLDDCIDYGQPNWTGFCLTPYKWAEVNLLEVE